jgi:hypothetical protein
MEISFACSTRPRPIKEAIAQGIPCRFFHPESFARVQWAPASETGVDQLFDQFRCRSFPMDLDIPSQLEDTMPNIASRGRRKWCAYATELCLFSLGLEQQFGANRLVVPVKGLLQNAWT